MDYKSFFKAAMGEMYSPYPYQERLAKETWPDLLDIPTGVGKTAAVILAWLFRLLHQKPDTPMRLVYCLPMRVLVQQIHTNCDQWLTRLQPIFDEAGVPLPTAHILMGGAIDEEWQQHPERPWVLIGTQDQLLSRALNRGYAMGRFRWPMHFGLLNNDSMWVLDETQLMGVGVETSAQLQGFRDKLGCIGPNNTLWMSATLDDAQLNTIDHPAPPEGRKILSLNAQDHAQEKVQTRLRAKKPLQQVSSLTLSKETETKYASDLVQEILKHHQHDSLTLVILNRVNRAQSVFAELLKTGRTQENTALVHSRFRRHDRQQHESLLHASGDRIVVATQAIEAGVDVSARTMFTELAPWPSLVQRWGRCNRAGEFEDAQLFWIDMELYTESKSGEQKPNATYALPYEVDELEKARTLLHSLEDGGPESLKKADYITPSKVRPIVRRRDLLDLFDTTPDLSGNDIDISRFIRDDRDTDIQVFWRDLAEKPPSPQTVAPHPSELCGVSISQFKKFFDKLKKKKDPKLPHFAAWTWSHLDKEWCVVENPRPGQTILLPIEAGGYNTATGWNGVLRKAKEPMVEELLSGTKPLEAMDDDPETCIDRWITLTAHLSDVTESVKRLLTEMKLPDAWKQALIEAAQWHDVGKAHAVFQERLLEPGKKEHKFAPPSTTELWAKSNHNQSPNSSNNSRTGKYFRHELASALAWLANTPESHDSKDLIAYLIASHHGKVRFSIRALPDEQMPEEPNKLFARGVWDGDELPPVTLPDGRTVGSFNLDLSPMQLGEGSWLERMINLLNDSQMGPFRLCYLETLLRVGDWRGSAAARSLTYKPIPTPKNTQPSQQPPAKAGSSSLHQSKADPEAAPEQSIQEVSQTDRFTTSDTTGEPA